MKILKLIIPNFQQFRNFELDLTHPEGHEKAGTPLEKVCLIGTNGTGKSTILEGLNYFVNMIWMGETDKLKIVNYIIKFEIDNEQFYFLHYALKPINLSRRYANSYFFCHHYNVGALQKVGVESFFLEEAKYLISSIVTDYGEERPVFEHNWHEFTHKYKNYELDDSKRLDFSNDKFMREDGTEIKPDFIIHSPAESLQNMLLSINDIPNTNVNESLKLNDSFKNHHIVSNETITDFWTQLIFLLKQRESKLKEFAQKNKKKTYEEIENEFDKENPEILKAIAVFWNKILDKSNLYFDYENAKNPIQLLDNLQAYIKNKHTHEVVPYNALSTGIRNFMFRLGHIFSLYFNKNIENGFLLVDEPENSLFPDFLYDLIDIYLEIIDKNTQFFVATHNPIIASQFEPYERVILRFDDEGFVQAHKGESPVGDDPNDLLENDFAVRNLMPRQGREAFKTYQSLRRTLRETTDEDKKQDLITTIAALGRLYNF